MKSALQRSQYQHCHNRPNCQQKNPRQPETIGEEGSPPDDLKAIRYLGDRDEGGTDSRTGLDQFQCALGRGRAPNLESVPLGPLELSPANSVTDPLRCAWKDGNAALEGPH